MFSGPTAPVILYNVVFESPMRPRDLVPTLPRDIEAVIAIALAKDPARRFGSAWALADALRRAARGELSASERVAAEEVLALNPWKG